MNPGPRDSSLLFKGGAPLSINGQSEHRSTEVWRLGGGDAQRCRRRKANQSRLPELHHKMILLLELTGFYGIARISSLQLDWGLISALVERWRPETHTFHLPVGECSITLQDVGVLTGLCVDGDPVIGATLTADEEWDVVVESVFGHRPPNSRFNGDHSGSLVHFIWIPYLRDLSSCGKYAWGADVLAFLYRELCKSCKLDIDEVVGCLILLQLWAWERLPTMAPIRTEISLIDEDFWLGQLAGPHGMRWLVHHSFSEKNGRTLPVYRVILDDIGPSHFIWQPYSKSVLESLPSYCLRGQEIWRYCGPLICIFIVEPHQPNRVLKQFGMFQRIPDQPEDTSDLHKLTLQGKISVNWVQKHQSSINVWNSRLTHLCESDMIVGASEVAEYDDWYKQRTRRFHSRMGSHHVYVGELFKSIARRSENLLPEVSELAYLGWHDVQQRSVHGFFETLPVEERRNQEKDARKVAGRRAKCGGHGGGREGARCVRRRVDGDVCVDAIVPTALGEDDHDFGAAADDNGSSFEQPSNFQQPSEVNEPPIDHMHLTEDLAVVQQPFVNMDYFPSFSLGLTPGDSLIPTPKSGNETSQQPMGNGIQKSMDPSSSFDIVKIPIQQPPEVNNDANVVDSEHNEH
ncbi:serine/threonine-protein phosphatase 7 long form homolog [Apium graveolens]|uniref:serine/threonine-protein phosphatase 7 long form homolog n=1 Tax=Apium graveolens TaxID=4045 RepID=UPI003D7A9851